MMICRGCRICKFVFDIWKSNTEFTIRLSWELGILLIVIPLSEETTRIQIHLTQSCRNNWRNTLLAFSILRIFVLQSLYFCSRLFLQSYPYPFHLSWNIKFPWTLQISACWTDYHDLQTIINYLWAFSQWIFQVKMRSWT